MGWRPVRVARCDRGVSAVYESIGDGIGAALQGVGAAVEETQEAISAKGLDLANKLDSALASGNQGDIRVELTALYQFFGELREVLTQLDAAEKSLSSESIGDVLSEVVDSLEGAFGESIPGVHAALQAAQDTFDPSSPGLLNTILGLQAMVTKNLQALYDTYTSYLAADKAGASALSDASHKYIGTQWQTISTESTVSHGWASFLTTKAAQ
jgi:hypothetical protein